MVKEYDSQIVLDLSCAAQRINKDYIKETRIIYDNQGNPVGFNYPNRLLVQLSLDNTNLINNANSNIEKLLVLEEDKFLTTEILKYFRRLMFSAVKGDNEFQTTVNGILESGRVKANELGFVICLPSVYKRDYARNQLEKRVRTLDKEYLGPACTVLMDKDAEILESTRSKNFESFNIHAIIDNKMVSWMSKTDLKHGACVIIKAKIKEHSKHYKYSNHVTRLHYVKTAQ
jgi:hypothetical protein